MRTLHTNPPDLDGETTQLPAAEHAPSLAEQRTQRRFRRGLARDLQRPARKGTAA